MRIPNLAALQRMIADSDCTLPPDLAEQTPVTKHPHMASPLEETFAMRWRLLGGPPLEREHRFDDGRRWRSDFAHPASRTIIEIEGGLWKGRHTSPDGFEADCEKYNAASLAGWTVFRFTASMIADVEQIEAVIRYVENRSAA